MRHKNCIKLYEIYEDKENIYIVTEYIDGGSLYERIKKRKISEREALRITKSILEAIVEYNKYNIVHRDIKPANVMFNKISSTQKIVKVIDFGLCADFTDFSASSLLRDKSGTACYLAPELVRMNKLKRFYNEKVDVFSVGIILYEILAGFNPFKSPDYQKSLMLNYNC